PRADPAELLRGPSDQPGGPRSGRGASQGSHRRPDRRAPERAWGTDGDGTSLHRRARRLPPQEPWDPWLLRASPPGGPGHGGGDQDTDRDLGGGAAEATPRGPGPCDPL